MIRTHNRTPTSQLPSTTAAGTQSQSEHPHLFLDEIVYNVFSRLDSPKTLLNATQVCKNWYKAVTLDFPQKRISPKFLQHLTRLHPQNPLNPHQLLFYTLNQNNNFTQGHYTCGSLEAPIVSPTQRSVAANVEPDNNKLIAMDFLNDGRLIRVFKFHLCITHLQPIAPVDQTITVDFKNPIKSCTIAKKCKKILILAENKSAEIIDLQDSLEDPVAFTALKLSDDIIAAHLSPNGDFLVTHNVNGIQLWDLKKNQHVGLACVPNTKLSNKIYFSPNCKHLVIIRNNSLLTWDYSQGLPQPFHGINLNISYDRGTFTELDFSPSGNKFVAKTSAENNFLIDFSSNPLKITKRATIPGYIRFNFLPNEDQLIAHDCGANEIFLIDSDLNKHLLHTPRDSNHYLYLRSCGNYLSPDGKHLAMMNLVENKKTDNIETLLDILNLSSQGTINQEVNQMPHSFRFDPIFFDSDLLDSNLLNSYYFDFDYNEFSTGVVFSPESNQIVLSPSNSENFGKHPQKKQFLLDFSPLFSSLF